MIIARIIIVAAFLGCGLFVRSAEAEPLFPIVSWGLNFRHDPEYFLKMAECGINVAGFAIPAELDAVHAAGMKAYVFGWKQCSDMDWYNLEGDAAQRFAALHRQVGDHPATLGYFLVDEPPARYFSAVAEMQRIIREQAPGKLCYADLLPVYAGAAVGAPSYREYLERYIAECRPDTLIFNFYFLFENNFKSVRPGYWENLGLVREAALAHDLPFRVCVGSVAHIQHPVSTFESLMLQVCIPLAYGAKGVEYFTYMAPSEGNYREAPIDQFGNPTPVWDIMRRVNRYIANLGPTLMKLRSTGVSFFPADPADSRPGPGAGSLVAELPGGTFLTGDFIDPETGERYVMIVNLSQTDSAWAGDLKFRNQPQQVRVLSGWSGGMRAFTGFEPWLFPGQGILLKLD